MGFLSSLAPRFTSRRYRFLGNHEQAESRQRTLSEMPYCVSDNILPSTNRQGLGSKKVVILYYLDTCEPSLRISKSFSSSRVQTAGTNPHTVDGIESAAASSKARRGPGRWSHRAFVQFFPVPASATGHGGALH